MDKFQWSEDVVGYPLRFIRLMIAIVQGRLIRIAIPKLGQQRSICIGLILYAIGMLLFGLAIKSWMMFAFMIPYALGGICSPALQGVMTSKVPKNEQGELQGGLTSLMNLSSIFGPRIMTYIFHFFTGNKTFVHLPGAPYFVASALMLIDAVLAVRSFRKQKQSADKIYYNSGTH